MSNRSCATGTVIRQSPDDAAVHEHHRADCKKLSCHRCGPKRARRYKHAIAREAEAHNLTRFLTLTLDPKRAGNVDGSVGYIRECWSKFRTYLKRKFGTRVQFIVILELQQTGMAHLHALIDRYIPLDWLNKAWSAVGGGFTWIKYVDVHRVSAYLTKYLTKELFTAVASKKKRVSTSRGIRLFEKQEPSGWWYDRKQIEDHYDFAVKSRHGIANVQNDDAGVKSFASVEPLDRDAISLNYLLPFEELGCEKSGGWR